MYIRYPTAQQVGRMQTKITARENLKAEIVEVYREKNKKRKVVVERFLKIIQEMIDTLPEESANLVQPVFLEFEAKVTKDARTPTYFVLQSDFSHRMLARGKETQDIWDSWKADENFQRKMTWLKLLTEACINRPTPV